MGYAFTSDEDVASSLLFKEGAPDDFLNYKTKKFHLYGPSAMACRHHGFPVMLTYMDGPHSRFLFLDAPKVVQLLKETDIIRRALTMMPLLLSFRTLLDGADQTFVVDRGELKEFWRDLDSLRAPLSAYVRENGCLPYTDTPVREGPPTAEGVEKTRQPYGIKHVEPGGINLSEIDEGVLLALLYNNACVYGDDLKAYRGAEMTPEEGRHIFKEMERLGMPTYFDVMNARPIKSCFTREGKERRLSLSNYWGFNGVPVVSLVPLARRGIYQYLSDSAYRSYKNEVTIRCELLLSQSHAFGRVPRGDEVVEEIDRLTRSALSPHAIEGWQRDQAEAYAEALRPENCGNEYQLSLFNANPHEVGYLIEPFTRQHVMRVMPKAKAPRLG